MARFLKPLVRSGGYYPSRKWTPLVYPGGYTTANGGEQPEPEAVLKTVTGSLIHIADALALPAEALTVNVEPIQDLHGYDNPWPAGGGKNKFDPSVMPTPTSTIQYHAFYVGDGDWIASTDAPYVSGNATVFFLAGDVSSGASTSGNGISPSSGRTQTAVDGYVTIAWRALDNVDPSQYHIQIESGSTIRTWTPYSNICPISGRTSATVTRTGKNLLSSAIGKYNWAGGVRYINDTGPYCATEDKVSICGGQTYIVSFNNTETTNAVYFSWFNGDTFLGNGSAYSAPWKDTAPTNADRVAISFRNENNYTGNPSVSNVQLELGSTASAYEPYQGNTYTIQLGDTVYGGTLDVINGRMTVLWTYGSKLLSDGDFYVIETLQNTKHYRYLGAFFDAKIVRNGKAICNLAPYMYTNSDTTHFYTTYQKSGLEIWLPIDTPTTTEIQACEEIAEPFEITLTPTQIDILLGTNNLWADAGDSTLTYYAEGEASTSEALGILLGGTYNNPGGADDVSDDEALGILLGGS